MNQPQTPDWVRDAVFYQIFPDRFNRGHHPSLPPGIKFQQWGSPPDFQHFQGGNLYGIVEKLDYLSDLGVNALYLNPIFSSAANHRYHTFDFMEVDPLLGGNDGFRLLLETAHSKGFRIMLDGVFNHASRGFWPFHHILENGRASPYLDWFIIHDWPLRPYSSSQNLPVNYAAWWNIPALPKLNTSNPDVQEYIFSVARSWVQFGIDAWRLDVPNEIDDDDFWRRFRSEVKAANPDTYICGEIWGEAHRWLKGDQFDATMNYIFSWSTMSFFGGRTLRPDYSKHHFKLNKLDAPDFANTVDYMLGLYPESVTNVQLNLLDSHDTARALWVMGDDSDALKLSVLFQMTMPGAPCIYYGSEVGMSAGDDPHCREAFPWNNPESWDTGLLAHYQQATALRHAYPALRRGTYKRISSKNDLFAFERELEEERIVVLFNAGETNGTIMLDGYQDARFTTIWPLEADSAPEIVPNMGGKGFQIPRRSALILRVDRATNLSMP